MASEYDSRTWTTLLRRLRDLDDREAWDEFVGRYVPKIYGWCKRYRLQEADAADVTQDVLGKLVTAMQSFHYDPSRGSFRGWLKTVTGNTIRDLAASWSRPDRGGGQHLDELRSPQALQNLTAELEAEAERELLREAEARVRLRVQPRTWDAYRLAAVEQVPAAEVAARVGLSVAEVYVAKSRVIRLLRQEVETLDP